MPESCFICLDSTEYMRNGDYYPNRLFGVLEFVNFLVEAKMNKNAENTVGFLCAGGNACDVRESLTADIDRILASLGSIEIKGKVCHFSAALRIAALALNHRSETRSEKRIVMFLGSPLRETLPELDLLAQKLRKDSVAVDVVTFGVPDNVAPLQHFAEKVSKDGNSCFVSIPEGKRISDVLMDSPVFTGPDTISVPPLAFGASGGPSGGNLSYNFGFSIDPNADPDLQRALQLSMEEEMQRQAAAASAANNLHNQGQAQAPISTGDVLTAMNGVNGSSSSFASIPPHSSGRLTTFEEDLQRALLLSLQEAPAQDGKGAFSESGSSHAEGEAPSILATAHLSALGASSPSEQGGSTEQEAIARSRISEEPTTDAVLRKESHDDCEDEEDQ